MPAPRRRWRPILAQLDAAAAFWLGETLPPVDDALRAAEWRPDPRARYCPRCGVSVGAHEVDPAFPACAACRDRRLSWRGVARLGAYRAPLREWILAIKTGPRWADMGERLGFELGAALRRANLAADADAVIVPAPMPPLRRWYRGIDHARVIADGVARRLGAPLLQPLRSRDRAPQVMRSASARRRSNAIVSRGRAEGRGRDAGGGLGTTVRGGPGSSPAARSVCGRHVILVDDVMTTGATAGACVRSLRRLGASAVTVAVVAVADPPGRAGAGEHTAGGARGAETAVEKLTIRHAMPLTASGASLQ